MTPLRFEADHAATWHELEHALAVLEGTATKPLKRKVKDGQTPLPQPLFPVITVQADRVAALYRATCEHLALARARSYPMHLIERLEGLTQRAHQAVYRRSELGLGRLGRLFRIDFPIAVRRHKNYFLAAALLFYVPTIAMGIACYLDPSFVLTVADAATVQNYDSMYSDAAEAVGRRSASTDWVMFGFYIKNNIGIAFQCFAAGIFLGVGSAFFLAYNGFMGGAAAGYLTWHGHANNFYSFVITHGAFELTAIVISGAAGLMLGHALLAPGRRTRAQALQHAASESVVLIYGTIAFLVIAAALEAFWSSSRWVEPGVKYAVGATCWLIVTLYLTMQGRASESSAVLEARA